MVSQPPEDQEVGQAPPPGADGSRGARLGTVSAALTLVADAAEVHERRALALGARALLVAVDLAVILGGMRRR